MRPPAGAAACIELAIYDDLEQVEDAPEYDPKVVLTAELIEQYLGARSKVPA